MILISKIPGSRQRPPSRSCLVQPRHDGSPARQLACVSELSLRSLGPECLWDSTLSLGSSTTRDTCVFPALVPSVRSLPRGWCRGRSRRCRCDGYRHFRWFQQSFARPTSNPPSRGAEDHGAILPALPSSFGTVLGRLRSSRSTQVPVK